MPVTPNFMERLILLKFNQGPGPLLDLLGGLAFKAVSIAVRVGVFEVLGGDSLSAKEVASRIEADQNGTMLLLKALEAIGYVREQNGRYTNTPMTSKWMLSSSPNHIADMFIFWEGVLERWGYLDEAIRQGEPPMLAWKWFDEHPNGWKDYSAAMMSTARMADKEILSKVKLLPGAQRLLDVGGGHGLHAINFCHRYPDISATVFDWPQTREIANSNIATEGMEGRVTFQEGDFWVDDLGSGYDVALLFNVIHMYKPDKNIGLLQKVGGALNTNSMVIILDQMALKSSGPTAKATAGLVGLDLFVEVNGKTYPPDEVGEWLKATGFRDTQKIFLRNVPGFALVVGKKVG